MRKILSLLCITFLTFSLLISNAEAKRFGGGKSFGTQRSTSNYSRTTQAAQTPSKTSGASKWLAPLAGLAMGGLLASLFMGNGLGAGLLSWLAIGVVLFLVYSMLRKKFQPQSFMQQTAHQQHYNDNVNYQPQPVSSLHNAPQNHIPADFDSDAFLRDAKTKFIRLQAAYDQNNSNDLREFTTPEVFAEIQLQIQERGAQENKTDVFNLNAELLDVADEFGVRLVSVRFSGLIREDINQAANSFNEIWNFRQEQNRWYVAGVQQS